jgi:hypothetical protein
MVRSEFPNLWSVIKLLLLLSHGQASVEKGRSVNKEVSVEHLAETSLIAQQLNYTPKIWKFRSITYYFTIKRVWSVLFLRIVSEVILLVL